MPGIRRLVCVVILAIAATAQNPPGTAKPELANAQPAPASPNVIVITMDTTRADRMGFLGSQRGLTPNLDVLAKDSVVFTRAYSQAPLTPVSHSTIFTGTFPQYHHVVNFSLPLPTDLPYMPAILKEHGYSTGAFVGSIALDPTWEVAGFERGYDTYDAGFSWQKFTPATRYQTMERRAGDVVDHALSYLDKPRQGPFFIWVHVYDPHSPYDPPEPYKTRYAKALYDGEIAYVDSALGKFFEQLKAKGLYDNTEIFLTADHGESLGEHGEEEHGVFLYDETIHVPLVIKLRNGESAGKRIEDRVELADILSTVLGTADITVPDQVQGQSLLGFLEPGTAAGDAAAKLWQNRGAYSQSDYEHLTFAWSALESLRSGKYLFVQAPRRELYDEDVDPTDQHNVAPASPAITDTLSAKTKAFQKATTNTKEIPKQKLDEGKIRTLAMLGYVAKQPDSTNAAPGLEGADPKDKIEIANTVSRINNLLQNNAAKDRCDAAMPEIKKALVTITDISLLHYFLGGCYLEKANFPDAITEMRKAVKIDPGFSSAEVMLGRALVATGQDDEALVAFEHVVKNEPSLIDAHIFLISLYFKADRPQDEIRECHAVLKMIPQNFGANFFLGWALSETGDFQGAVAPLQKAIAGEPYRLRPHQLLADVYEKLGRIEDAKRERDEADRLPIPGSTPDGAPPTPQSNPER